MRQNARFNMSDSLISATGTVPGVTPTTGGINLPANTWRQHHLLLLVLAAWTGFNLRAGVLGVPPLLQHIGSSLGLNHSLEGLLTALPVFCFGAAALPGARLVQHFGAKTTVCVGMGLAVSGILIRSLPFGFDSGVLWLFGGTLLLGTGIGVAQPAVPRLLRSLAPLAVQQTSVVVTLGYNLGQVAAASIALPLLGPLGGWRLNLAMWAVPAALALGWLLFIHSPAPPRGRTVSPGLGSIVRTRSLWTMATIMACTNLAFFTANSWVGLGAPGGPNSSAAEVDLISLNVTALPVGLVLVLVRSSFVRSRKFYFAGGIAVLSGSLGWLLLPAAGPLWVGLIGAGSALAFSGTVAYPATLHDAGSIANFSGLLWTVAGIGAFLGPLAGGVAVDLLGWKRIPFAFVALAGLAMLWAANRVTRTDG